MAVFWQFLVGAVRITLGDLADNGSRGDAVVRGAKGEHRAGDARRLHAGGAARIEQPERDFAGRPARLPDRVGEQGAGLILR